jgi:glutamate N-acetyltransferase/amino-acid N-acetyltransferase
MIDRSDNHGFTHVDGGVTAARGFSAAGVSAGLKAGDALDLALVAAESPVPSAAVFTTNKVAAAPVVVSRRHVAGGRAHAVVVNAGNANACTGTQGEADASATAAAVGEALGCSAGEVIVASTGVIGVPLPVDRLVAAMPKAWAALSTAGGDHAARAIMTTDTFAKQAAVSFDLNGGTCSVGGMAKGSGMIAPNMATMLSVLTTDAPLSSAACDAALRAAVATTFNRVTVDSDTSTNDMVVLMASGAAGGDVTELGSAAFSTVAEAVRLVSSDLARMIARDGEGATKLITVTVEGAADESDAELAAFAIANSPLVKTAIFGGDANWGRVAMAIGKSGCELDPGAFDITFAGIEVCRGGTAIEFDEAAAAAALAENDVEIAVDLNLGDGRVSVWTCDLTYEYVRINGEYRS